MPLLWAVRHAVWLCLLLLDWIWTWTQELMSFHVDCLIQALLLWSMWYVMLLALLSFFSSFRSVCHSLPLTKLGFHKKIIIKKIGHELFTRIVSSFRWGAQHASPYSYWELPSWRSFIFEPIYVFMQQASPGFTHQHHIHILLLLSFDSLPQVCLLWATILRPWGLWLLPCHTLCNAWKRLLLDN